MRIEEANQAAWESIEPVDPFDLEQYREETGLTANLQAAYGNFVDESQFTSQWLHAADVRERNEQLRDFIGTEEFPEETMERFRTRNGRDIDYGAMAEYVIRNNPETTIKSNEALEQEMINELSMRRDYVEDVRDRANFAGEIGAGAGVMLGAVTDPLIAGSMVFGPAPALAGASFTRGIGYAAGRMGAYAATEEAAIQAQVYPWKQRIGSPYGVSDVMMSVGGAAVGGYLVGAGATIISKFLDGGELTGATTGDLKTWMETPDGQQSVMALREMEKELAEAPPGKTVNEFSAEIGAQLEELNAPRRPVVDQPASVADITDEQFAAKLNQGLDAELVNQPEVGEVNLEIPVYDATGNVSTKPLREALQELDAEEQQLVQMRDCLTNG